MSILVVGITGSLGRYFVDAAKDLGIHLHVLMRPESLADPVKAALVEGLQVHEGSVENYDSMVRAFTGIDVVISLIGTSDAPLQLEIVRAAKEAGVKRFIPSEFSCCLMDDKESVGALGYHEKKAVRDAIKAAGIEWTSIQSNGFFQWFAPGCFNMLAGPYPKSVQIYGDGSRKIGMTNLPDIAKVALLAATDPRAANTHLIISFPGTLYTQPEMIDLWEEVSGTKVERTYLSEEDLEKRLAEIKDDSSKYIEAITLGVAKGYYFLQLADCRRREGQLRAEELYPQIQHTTLRAFYENLVAEHNSK
eukprot:c1066_g1_i1.p1 GENE.c1066_g1_i1~~c1066_g1_i1.p1  ORF type:complete len:306 (+),score=83.91 c1066_g1_i1:42-959(+)